MKSLGSCKLLAKLSLLDQKTEETISLHYPRELCSFTLVYILILLFPHLEAISYISYNSKTAEVPEYLFIYVSSISGQKKKPSHLKTKTKTNGTIQIPKNSCIPKAMIFSVPVKSLFAVEYVKRARSYSLGIFRRPLFGHFKRWLYTSHPTNYFVCDNSPRKNMRLIIW